MEVPSVEMPSMETFLALLIEAAIGYPDFMVRSIGHPVMWMGRLIGFLDGRLNHDGMSNASRRAAGVLAALIAVSIAGAVAFGLEQSLIRLPAGLVPAALAASTLLAQRSLHDHVARVAAALESEGLAAGRKAVAHIVGRDTAALDEAGVARAAIESLAENFSDGVVAPALWLAIGGLAGGAVYKAVNTADSMIGHRTPRHEAFGWASARLDDLVNLPASRLSALLLIAAAASTSAAAAKEAWRAAARDARHHRSANAGWPEAAMAGALGLALAGPRSYGGIEIADALMGRGRRAATAADIRRALKLYRRADALLIALCAGLALPVAIARWL
jgi:adenosylcobinamide-phosphate synthase